MDSMRLGGLAKMILSSRRWMLIFEDFNQISASFWFYERYKRGGICGSGGGVHGSNGC
jgi:hypothetical protein